MRRGFLLAVLTTVALVGIVPAGHAAPATRDVSEVFLFADPSVVVGSSLLVRNDNGVAGTVQTSGLAPGDAVTVWWVIFNHPSECTTDAPFRCGEADLFDPDVETSVLHAAGEVIGGNGTGRFGSYLTEGDTTGALFGPGLLDSREADVHFVVRTHGPAIPGLIPAQIHTFDGGCDINTCEDLQAAVHET